MSSIEKVLDKYSSKVYKNRKKHILEKTDEVQEIAADVRTMPGVMTNRGCCYAGCKGVVLSPIKDAAVITHGPIGCGFYTWGTRRHKAKGDEDTKNFLEYCLSTDMQEADIVFGGEKKLRQAIKETVEIFDPATIVICSTCPVGLIGDDIHAVAAEAEKLYGRKVMAYSCEGYKGVSQSGGHHIASNGLIKHVIGTGDRIPKKFAINILGEYNIGGDGWEITRILKRIGYDIICSLPGDGSYVEIKSAHVADLNLVQCHRSINYVAEMMKEQYGTPWLKVNFIGVEGTIEALRNMAKFFDDAELTAKTEEVIADEVANILDDMEYYKSKLKGKTAALFVGGSRSHHYQTLLKELDMETILAGYEFGHRDDYEGREVIPTIKQDGDSKSIESIKVEKVPDKYKVFLSEERYEKLKEEIGLESYGGMIKDMENGSLIVDDLNHYETEEFLKLLKPDVFFSGIKDKYVAQKGGILSRQLHSYDYSGPYAGFSGAVNFARDVTMGIYTPAWSFVRAPWKVEPILEGQVAGGEA
ncbi:nitrogenase molybdenum-iron protein alpha chain [Cellulosilyticum sp. I15G10I2]|uniref:nitrogenase molybdenum-iron protein alpha chain n=1 Tax=Cellulosilyticum sp. I15G10I2 TaxID=1892843 RepID=UPI00085BE780|nr:nitrogenase molybdenum-iron protein alpha chain [Cellulosilyticum sp. I15G10I2]